MTKKVAIARVLSDMIKADNIIAEDEIRMLLELSRRYGIGEDDRQESQYVTFSEAVGVLMDLPYAQRESLIEDLRKMTMADGKCVQQEAMLMMAVRYCLGSECVVRKRANVVSGEALGVPFGRPKMIYVESEYDVEKNESIRRNLRGIISEVSVIGMDFIYIPRIAEDFGRMDADYLLNVISYLAPNVGSERRMKVYEGLCNVTTEVFCQNLLSRKLGITELVRTEPSLLVTIGTSNIPYVNEADGAVAQKLVTEYLKLRIDGDVMDSVNDFVDDYKQYVETMTSVVMSPEANRVMYCGFHRLLFDLLIFTGKRQDCTLTFDPIKGELKFEEIDDVISLTPKVKAIYLTMLQQNLCGSSRKMRLDDDALRVFREIYFNLGNDAESPTFDKDLTVALSRIKDEMKSHKSVRNIDCYVPVRGSGSVVTMNVNADQVYVLQNGEKVRMVDSRWKNY